MIDACVPGASLFLRAGEHLLSRAMELRKDITLVGRGFATVSSGNDQALVSTSGSQTLRGVHLRNHASLSAPFFAALVSGGALTLEGCSVTCRGEGSNDVIRVASGSCALLGCRIFDAQLRPDCVGIEFGCATSGRVEGTTICGLKGGSAGISICPGALRVVIANNTICDNECCGVWLQNGANHVTLGSNVMRNNGRGDLRDERL